MSLARECSESDFIGFLEKYVNEGHGIVPLLGSGISASAGLPTIAQLSVYLQKCIAMALCTDIDPTAPRPIRRWRPDTDKWPPVGDGVRTGDGRWLTSVESRWNALLADQWSSERSIFQQAVGDMADWRSSLQFLSRLETSASQKTTDNINPLKLGAPNPRVIDSFFLHVTASKQPGLTHRMLAHLALVLRTKILLTTNFDNLLEKAFSLAGYRPAVIDVHMGTELPHPDAMREPFSIVKMHGSTYGLRGDYSLDATPSENDLSRFITYVKGGGTGDPSYSLNGLLVAGLSGDDRRMSSFIKQSFLRIPALTVFWLCFSQRDIQEVKKLSAEIKLADPDKAGAIYLLRQSHQGLFLLRVYQELVGGLPSHGIIFPFQSRIAIPPQVRDSERWAIRRGSLYATDLMRRALERIRLVQEQGFQGRRRLVIMSGPADSGITPAASEAFDALVQENNTCIWIDLNDISSTDDLFEVLMDAFANAAGLDEWLPIVLESDHKSRARELDRILTPSGKKWILFLNAREQPGANYIAIKSSSEQMYPNEPSGSLPNGWLDCRVSGKDSEPTATADSFINLLKEISGCDCPHLSVVVLCRSEGTPENNTFLELLSTDNEPGSGYAEETWVMSSRTTTVATSLVSRLFKTCLADKSTCEERMRFILCLTLLQRTRYYSAFLAQPFNTDSRSPSAHRKSVNEHLESLEKARFIRYRPGGFVWLNASNRNAVRSLLTTYDASCRLSILTSLNVAQPEREQVEKALLSWDTVVSSVPALHEAFAKWYWRLFLSSDNPFSLFEAAHHAMEATRCRLIQEHRSIKSDILCSMETATGFLYWASTVLQNATRAVRKRGVSKGCCRRLFRLAQQLKAIDELVPQCFAKDSIELTMLTSASRALKRTILVLMRGIAYEVSEFATGYVRHCELAMLLLNEPFNISAEAAAPVDHGFRNAPGSPQRDKGFVGRIEKLEQWKTQSDSNSLDCLHWYRWLARLGRSSRSYHKAESAVVKALNGVKLGLDFGPRYCDDDQVAIGQVPDRNRTICEVASYVIDRRGKSPRTAETAVAVAKVFETYAQILLDHYVVSSRCADSKVDLPPLQCALTCIAQGKRLLDLVLATGLATGDPIIGEAQSTHVRLLLHQAIINYFVSPVETALTAAREQMPLLDEAGALLRVCNPTCDSTLWAILPIHRGILHFEQALKYQLKNGTVFAAFCKNIADEWRNGKRDSSWGLDASEFAKVTGALDDARQCFEAGSNALAARRKNVFWSTWYFHRMLTLLEYYVWARTDGDDRIPMLDLQSAPRGTPTIADQCLDDSLRMVRRDTYRLATVLDAYANVSLALHARLATASEKMPMRQRDMRNRLQSGLEQLSRVISLRAASGESHSVSPTVRIYIEQVIKRVKSTLDVTREAWS